MRSLYFALAVSIVALLPSCRSTGVIPTGDGQYMIGKKDGTPGLGVSLTNKAEVYSEANQFCAKRHGELVVIREIVTPAAPAQLGSTELYFRCDAAVDENDQLAEQVDKLHDMESAKLHSFLLKVVSASPSGLQDPTAVAALGILRLRAERGDADSLGPYGAALTLFCSKPDIPDGTDCRDAAKYLNVSASNGDPYSMHNLAVCYRTGIGVERSQYAAAEWYIAAADVFLEREKREAAMAELEQALAVVPNHPIATEKLKKIISSK